VILLVDSMLVYVFLRCTLIYAVACLLFFIVLRYAQTAVLYLVSAFKNLLGNKGN
jgi:hypothetical protein